MKGLHKLRRLLPGHTVVDDYTVVSDGRNKGNAFGKIVYQPQKQKLGQTFLTQKLVWGSWTQLIDSANMRGNWKSVTIKPRMTLVMANGTLQCMIYVTCVTHMIL
jgi:hypothetical protein